MQQAQYGATAYDKEVSNIIWQKAASPTCHPSQLILTPI